MRKWFIAFFLLAAIGIGSIAVWRYQVPMRQVSSLYLRYEHAEGIAASYIHNYPINDTLCLDVTLLEALSDSGWDEIKRTFNVTDMLYGSPDSIVIISGYCPQGHPELRMNTTCPDSNEFKIVDMASRKACLFHAHSMAECNAALLYKYNRYTQKFFQHHEPSSNR